MRAILLAFVFIFAGIAGVTAESQTNLPAVPLTIESNGGETRTEFVAELAASPQERARGLMFRTDLAQDRGMLFDFKQTRMVSMWMKNTPLSLDMIFSDDKGVVIYVARNTVPYSEEIITPGVPAYAVLEVTAGTAHRLNIKPGDRLLTAIFGTGR
jgi:uncharacterized membrane protein (UPF0127 family)